MIIKCLRIFNTHTKEYIIDKQNSFLTINKHYQVLEMFIRKNGIDFQIIPDNASLDQSSGGITPPILVSAQDFEIISGKIPKNWEIKENNGSYIYGPDKWLDFSLWEEDFWQDWCNSTPAALKCYKEELLIIQSTDLLDKS